MACFSVGGSDLPLPEWELEWLDTQLDLLERDRIWMSAPGNIRVDQGMKGYRAALW